MTRSLPWPMPPDSYIACFWRNVSRSGGCWLWTRSVRNKGYGAVAWKAGGRMVQERAHRLSWAIAGNDLPPGMFVLHKCDNPRCVNPDHLFLGTKADNNADMRRKGRAVAGGQKTGVDTCLYKRGESHHAARLTAEIVTQIRDIRARGASYSQLGKQFGINQSHAWKICTGMLWRQLRKEVER